MAETKYFPLLGTLAALTDDWALQVYDDDLGLWLTLAQADEEAEMVRAGIPVLRGPYVVDFSDIPLDGNTKTLWTPAVGDVLLRLFPDTDAAHLTQWDAGFLFVGQNPSQSPANYVAEANHGNIGLDNSGTLDSVCDAVNAQAYQADTRQFVTARVFQSADPVQILYYNPGDSPAPTTGHIELYALVAHAVAP